MATSIRE
jgi:hypothetical protein